MASSTTSTVHPTTSAGPFRGILLALGPAVTFAVLLGLHSRGVVDSDALRIWLLGAVVAWSPMPLSIPAIVLDHERDTALAGRNFAVRAMALIPWLMCSPRSSVRGLMTASILMWLVLSLAAAQVLGVR